AACFLGLSVLASNLLKSAHGRELVVGGFVCEATNASAPDNIRENVSIVTLPVVMEYKPQLRHALYEHRFCARAIAAWLGQHVGRSPELATSIDFLYDGSVRGLA